MNDTDNSGTQTRLQNELDLLEAETFEILDHTEATEELGSTSTGSCSTGSCTSCCS